MKRLLGRIFDSPYPAASRVLNKFSTYKLGKVYNWKLRFRLNPVKVKIVDVYFDQYRGFSYGAECVDESLPKYIGADLWCKPEELSELNDA